MAGTHLSEERRLVSESTIFIDGDTLVLTLPSSPDFNLCANRILYEIGHREQDNLSNVLVDCSRLDESGNHNMDEFVDLGREIADHGIRLLLLDASPGVCRRFESQVPDAVWIDSDTAGYFGQHFFNAKRSALG